MTLSPAQGRQLLQIARAAIASEFDDRVAIPRPDGMDQWLGVFVTLRRSGRLRGCIGRIEADAPLVDTTADMARAAAFDDPRFKPLTADELGDVSLEVSVLSALRPASSPEDVVVGEHGLMVSAGGRRGLLLPQVPVAQGWDRTTFLRHACEKAGLPAEAWQDPATQLHVFTAQIFEEE